MTSTVPLSPGEARQAPSGRPPAERGRGALERVYSDDHLARLASRGNADAFAALYERHHHALSRYCRAILHDEEDAQDALQSAMMRAYAALQSRQRDLKVRPWLFRIVHNEAISILRRRPQTAELTLVPEPAGATLEQTVVEREDLTTLLGDLDALPERQRAALVMRELNGLSIAEIAAALSASRGAAKQMLYEARCALHEFAEGREMDCAHVRRSISDGDGRALRARRMRAHVRECAGCRQFASEIDARTAKLQALIPPLPAAWATAALVKSLAHGTAHAGGAGAGAGAGAVGGGGAVASHLTSSLALKAIAGSAVIGIAAAGTADLVKSPGTPRHPPPHVSTSHGGQAAGSGGQLGSSASAGARTSHASSPAVVGPGAAPNQAAKAKSKANRAEKRGPEARGHERANGRGAAHVRGGSSARAKSYGRTSTPARGHEHAARTNAPPRSRSDSVGLSRGQGSSGTRAERESQGAKTGSHGESSATAIRPSRRESPAQLPTEPTPVIP